MGLELGPLGDHHRIHIHHAPAALTHQAHHLLQQHQAVGPFPLGIGGREVLADIPQREGTKQGIHDRVHQHIGIAVAIEAEASGVLQGLAAQDQWAPRHQPVDVVAVADADVHGSTLEASTCSLVPSRPITTTTAPGASGCSGSRLSAAQLWPCQRTRPLLW